MSGNNKNSSSLQVDYATLDRAKVAFIEAGRRTLDFAKPYGFVPNEGLGASANLFALDLTPFLAAKAEKLFMTLLPEGLGTADDARPTDLSEGDLESFWYNIALKTVATITNDAASSGIQPLLLSLYLPSGTPETVFTPSFMTGFLDGIVDGCKRVGCVYFSGETPQLKSKFLPDRLDIAGSVVGIIPAGLKPVESKRLSAGDRIVFVESSGPHENGFTVLRELAIRLPRGYHTEVAPALPYWKAINKGSHLYSPLIQSLLRAGIHPTSIEPITGHGWQKIMRSSTPLRYVIHTLPSTLPVFTFVQQHLNFTDRQMLEIFNCGAGIAIFLSSDEEAEQTIALAHAVGLKAHIAGYTVAAPQREVVIEPFSVTLSDEHFSLRK
jgi:phosphoribosylformylglycinamidine cyclo-ligase